MANAETAGPPRREGGLLSPTWLYGVLGALTVLTALASLVFGRTSLGDEGLRQTLLTLRAWRFCAAFVSGVALAVGGVMVQGLFRNPLASPSVLGTTAGAALGGRVALLASSAFAGGLLPPELGLPLGCIAGAWLALLILLLVSRSDTDLVVLLLTGFLLSSLFISAGAFLASLAQERWELARAMMAFTLGDVSGVGPRPILIAVPFVLAGTSAAWFWGRSLDAMLSGADEAATLGVEVATLRRWIVVWTAVMTGAAVAVAGTVGFVGLVVPHALRPFAGVKHRRLVPAAALAGGTFVAACDVLCRVLPARSEVPLGVVTGLIGAPVFLVLLLRGRRGIFHG